MLIAQISESHMEYGLQICKRIVFQCRGNDYLIKFCYYFNFRLPTIICNDTHNVAINGLTETRGSKWLLGIVDVLDLIQEVRS